MPKLLKLLLHGLGDVRMAVAQVRDANTSNYLFIYIQRIYALVSRHITQSIAYTVA